jgi:Flp pilus assembly protein TadG
MKKNFVSNQTGAIAIMTVVLLPLLLGFMALALDVGYVLLNKNRMQVAADSAALAAAAARQHGQDINTATALALSATQANGFTQGNNHSLITVAIPPGGTESFANDTSYVRVTVSQPVNAFLSWIFGITHTDTSATAVGGPAGYSQPCLLSMASAASGALSVKGNGVVTAKTCGIFVNSSSASALKMTGNVTMTASTIHVVGNYTSNGNVSVSPITTGSAITPDPFIAIPIPLKPACDQVVDYKKAIKGILTLNAGTYCGGITVKGNYAVNFNPGTYTLYGGGITLSGNVSPVTGTGVSFINTGNSTSYPFGPLNLAGNVELNLSAPTTGTYAGMLFIQDPLNTQDATFVGNAGSQLAGNFYLPSSQLTFTGNSGTDIPIGSVVALQVKINGNTRFSMTNTYGGGSNSSARAGLYQ